MEPEYSLVVTNNSGSAWTFCLFQKYLHENDLYPLAWFTNVADPKAQITFTWTMDYMFMWAETGVLKPGVIFHAAQAWPTTLTTKNEVTLSRRTTPESQRYTFEDRTSGPRSGTLTIIADDTIPPKMLSVGVGMSGAGTFAMQAGPNLNYYFVPEPTYWLTFGDYVQGEALDLTAITNATEVPYDSGVYSMTATLNQDNTWTVEPGRG